MDDEEYARQTNDIINEQRRIVDGQSLIAKAWKKKLKEISSKWGSSMDMSNKDLGKFNKSVEGVSDAVVDLTKTFGSTMKSMAETTATYSSMNSTIDAATDVFSAATDALSAMTFVGGQWWATLTLQASKYLVKGVSEVAKAAMKVFDPAMKNLIELSKAGAMGTEGLTGFGRSLIETGLGIDRYSGIIKRNSEDLASIGGSTMGGITKMNGVIKHFTTNTDSALYKLGFNIDEISDTVVDFQKMNLRLGNRQELSQAQLIAGAEEYGKELDMIAKLTGKQRSEIQKEREAALSQSRFRAKVAALDAQGKHKEARALEDFVNRYTGDLRQAAMDMSTGFVNTTASIKVAASGLAPAMQNAIKSIENGVSVGEAMNTLDEQIRKVTGPKGPIATLASAIESGSGPFIDLANALDNIARTSRDVTGANKDQETQLEKTDKQYQKLVQTAQNFEKTTANLQGTLATMPSMATAALTLSKAYLYASDVIQSNVGPGERATENKSWYESTKDAIGEFFHGTPEEIEQEKRANIIAKAKDDVKASELRVKQLEANLAVQKKRVDVLGEDAIRRLESNLRHAQMDAKQSKLLLAKVTEEFSPAKAPTAIAATNERPTIVKPDDTIKANDSSAIIAELEKNKKDLYQNAIEAYQIENKQLRQTVIDQREANAEAARQREALRREIAKLTEKVEKQTRTVSN